MKWKPPLPYPVQGARIKAAVRLRRALHAYLSARVLAQRVLGREDTEALLASWQTTGETG